MNYTNTETLKAIENFRRGQASQDKRTKQQAFTAARNLFHYALKIITRYCKKDVPNLATLYYNIGRCFQQLEQYSKAKFFLETSLTLRTKFLKVPKAEIQKIRNALHECEMKIDRQIPRIETESFA